MSQNRPTGVTTRREILFGAGALSSIALAESIAGAVAASPGRDIVPLPTPEIIRRDYQRMVDFGPRLPGHPNHVRFVEFLAREFQQIGLTLGPCDSYAYRRWDPLAYGLDLEDDGTMKPVPNIAYYVRSHPAPPGGITAPLYYGGTIDKNGPTALGEVPAGSIVVFDGKLPQTTIQQLVDPLYIHLPDAEKAEYLSRPYKRLWLMPAFPLEAVLAKGAAGVVIIIDVSDAMIAGNFSPHASHYKPPLPTLFVGNEAGNDLRRLAKLRKRAKLTLDAQWVDCTVPSLTAILPGESDEVVVIDTHTDGQNFIEENGGMAMLQLAGHFASLPKHQRLRRTLVFAGWPGHMSGALPECAGWVRAHPDLVKRAAAAVTIEHLGASEWEDVPGKGYAPTGRNEYMNFATTGGVLTNLVKDGFRKFDLRQHGIQAGPGTTTGAVFHDSGVPHVGIIGGPNYLLGIVKNGHMDKLDTDLATRQTAMIAELLTRIDGLSATVLRSADHTLGAHPALDADTSVRAPCHSTTAQN